MSKFPQIGICAKPVKHQVTAAGHLERLLKTRGYRVRVTYDLTSPEQIVFCWGWGRAKEVRKVNHSAIILCMDHGFSRDRKQFINTGWSTPPEPFGLNGWAEHPVIDDGGARSARMGWWNELRPIREMGATQRALVLGQVYGDAMIVDHVEDYSAWLKARMQELRRDGWEVRFRPHPQMLARSQEYDGISYSRTGSRLADDLDWADLAVAMNSNGLVDAFVHGVPAVIGYNKGSMLWPLIRTPGAVADGLHRAEWWGRMAYCQWAYEELSDGTWYAANAPIMHELVEGRPCRPWHSTGDRYV